PEGHTESACRLSDELMKEIVERADKIVCVSQSTCEDLKKYFNVPHNRLSVVYNTLNPHSFKPLGSVEEKRVSEGILKKYGLTQGPYLLFVGTLEPRKNLVGLLKAFEL